jgi:hypothetical protein
MDPITISAAIVFFGAVAVAILVITVQKMWQWFRSRGAIKESSNSVIAFSLAERINNKRYAEVPGVFDKRPTNTRIVQGFYDPDTDRVLDARALASSSPPRDQEIITQHDEGDGLVIYT